jgi:hypothetical protein
MDGLVCLANGVVPVTCGPIGIQAVLASKATTNVMAFTSGMKQGTWIVFLVTDCGI